MYKINHGFTISGKRKLRSPARDAPPTPKVPPLPHKRSRFLVFFFKGGTGKFPTSFPHDTATLPSSGPSCEASSSCRVPPRDGKCEPGSPCPTIVAKRNEVLGRRWERQVRYTPALPLAIFSWTFIRMETVSPIDFVQGALAPTLFSVGLCGGKTDKKTRPCCPQSLALLSRVESKHIHNTSRGHLRKKEGDARKLAHPVSTTAMKQ